MNKKIGIKRITALAIAAVMSVQIFAGCSSGGSEEDNAPIKAASVAFSANGDYKTTVTSSEIDLSDLTAKDVSVTYESFDEDGYNKALENAEKKYEDELNEFVEKAVTDTDKIPQLNTVSLNDYISEKSVGVKNVKAEKDKLELSFNDPDASDNMVGYYNVHLNGKKYGGEDIVVDLGVEYKDYELTPNIKYVLSNAEETRLTLTLNDGSFADNVTKDDITLSGSFESMKIDSLSCADKNLTMQLTGKPQKPEGLSTYIDGCVAVRPQAVIGAGSEIKAYVPIKLVGKSLDASTIKANGDSVTAELELIGTSTPLDKLTSDDFQFDKDVTVTSVKKISDTRAELTMTVNGAKDASTAAAVLNDKKLKIADEDEITISAAQTHFYPVFDGVESSGDNIKLTIIAYADNGSFSEDIKSEQIILGDDFKDGSVESVERQNDTTAKIIFTIPANGQKSESLDVDGKITIKAGAMISQWGEPTTEEFSYARNYSQESVGREPKFANATFGGMTDPDAVENINWYFRQAYNRFKTEILEVSGYDIPPEVDIYFENYYNDLDNLITEITAKKFPNGAPSMEAVDAAVSVRIRSIANVQMTGAIFGFLGLAFATFGLLNEIGITGENKEMINALKETEKKTEKLKEMVEDEYHRLCNLKAAQFKSIVTECDVRVGDLKQYINICKKYFNEKSLEDLGVEMPEELLVDGKTTQFAYDLSTAIADACRHKEAGYESCQRDFNMLQKKFELVCNQLLLEDGADPLTALDQAYANIDNFSTTSYYLKKGYRVSLLDTLNEARALIRIYKMASYNFKTNSDGSLYTTLDENGKKVYVADSGAIDMTDEDLFEDAKLRLLSGEYTYDDGTMEKYNQDMGINNEEIVKSTAEYKKMYKTFYNRPWLCDFLYSKNNPNVINAVYNYKIEEIDLTGYTNPLFAEMKSCTQLANIKVNTNGTGTYVDENSHWGTRQYSKLWAYSQESGSSIVQTDENAKPYCYSLNTTVSCIDNCYSSDDMFRAYTNYKDYQVAEFFNRLKDSGRNLIQEMTNAGIPIGKDYANASKERGKGSDNYDPDNLYGVALEHTTDSKYDAKKVRNSWNTYTKLYYWDAEDRNDVSPNRIMVWRGLSAEPRNKVAIFIP